MIFSKKVLVLFLAVVIAGSLIYFLVVKQGLFSSKEETTENVSEEVAETTETPLPVKVKTVKRGELVIRLRSQGEAVTDRIAVVKTELSGIVGVLYG